MTGYCVHSEAGQNILGSQKKYSHAKSVVSKYFLPTENGMNRPVFLFTFNVDIDINQKKLVRQIKFENPLLPQTAESKKSAFLPHLLEVFCIKRNIFSVSVLRVFT